MSPTVATLTVPTRNRPSGGRTPRVGFPSLLLAVATLGTAVVLGLGVAAPVASAAQPTVGLGTATPFAVLGSSTVTNTGPSVISGDLGVYAGSAATGFPPGTLIGGGTQHLADAVAQQAQHDATTAYNDAAGRTPVVTEPGGLLGGQTLAPGVYKAASALSLTGTVTLDAGGDPNAVFIFQAGSTLVTASGSMVSLTGGASACNVFWQVGSSATLGTTTTFVGTILALASVSLQTDASVQGRVIARTGAVTLDTNTITRPTCPTVPPGTTATTTPASTTATTSGAGAVGSGGASGTTGATTSALSGSGVVPLGAPGTGFGGAARPTRSPTLAVLGATLVLSGAAAVLVARRRRAPSVQVTDDGGASGG